MYIAYARLQLSAQVPPRLAKWVVRVGGLQGVGWVGFVVNRDINITEHHVPLKFCYLSALHCHLRLFPPTPAFLSQVLNIKKASLAGILLPEKKLLLLPHTHPFPHLTSLRLIRFIDFRELISYAYTSVVLYYVYGGLKEHLPVRFSIWPSISLDYFVSPRFRFRSTLYSFPFAFLIKFPRANCIL